MRDLLRRIFFGPNPTPAGQSLDSSNEAIPTDPATAAPAAKLDDHSDIELWEYDPERHKGRFYEAVAKMRRGTYVAYESVNREWHVFVIEGPPSRDYPDIHPPRELAVRVRRVRTGRLFTMPVSRLTPCEAGFVSRDGTGIRKGEGWRV